MAYFASLVRNREPSVHNVIGFVDGVNIPCMTSSDPDEQSEAYNGYMHDTCCNNVFAFSPEGKAIWAAINHPGSWHDAQVCASLIRYVVEQGFPRSGALTDIFVGPFSKKKRRRLAPELREVLLERCTVYTSLRHCKAHSRV